MLAQGRNESQSRKRSDRSNESRAGVALDIVVERRKESDAHANPTTAFIASKNLPGRRWIRVTDSRSCSYAAGITGWAAGYRCGWMSWALRFGRPSKAIRLKGGGRAKRMRYSGRVISPFSQISATEKPKDGPGPPSSCLKSHGRTGSGSGAPPSAADVARYRRSWGFRCSVTSQNTWHYWHWLGWEGKGPKAGRLGMAYVGLPGRQDGLRGQVDKLMVASGIASPDSRATGNETDPSHSKETPHAEKGT